LAAGFLLMMGSRISYEFGNFRISLPWAKRGHLMEQLDNMKFFNLMALAVFDRLYSAFPVPVEIDVGKMAVELLLAQSEFEPSFEALMAAGQTIDFLAQEGFLTHQGSLISGETYMQVRLTLKGLAILGSPDVLEAKKPLIASVKSAVGAVAKEGAAEVARQVVQKVFALSIGAAPVLASALAGS